MTQIDENVCQDSSGRTQEPEKTAQFYKGNLSFLHN